MGKRHTRRQFLTQAAGLAAVATTFKAGLSMAAGATRYPNFVVIIADDLGYGDLGCYGCPDIRTPVIDGLAAQGVRFTSFYANAPECTPTRTALMTGRYQHRVGGLECALGVGNVGRYDDAIRLRATHDLGLPIEETSIAGLLKDVGYATGICGKWHLGYEPKFLPSKHGFDHFFGPLGGNADYFHHTEAGGDYTLYLNDKPVQRDGYMTDLITDEAVQFIERQNVTPFFLDVSYTAPHSPYQGPNDRKDRPVSDEDWDKGSRETYAEMVEHMDKCIGRILKILDRKGLAENTVLVFMSDNGANKRGRNAPFSGYKGGLFEGGIRVPCIVRCPGVVPRGVVSDCVSITMDFTASIGRIAGVSPPRERPFDGIDILQEIKANRLPRKRTLFWRARRGERTWRAVRDGSLKYISRQEGEVAQEYLFDLESDPAEKNSLLATRASEAERLKRLLEDWEKEVRHKR